MDDAAAAPTLEGGEGAGWGTISVPVRKCSAQLKAFFGAVSAGVPQLNPACTVFGAAEATAIAGPAALGGDEGAGGVV